MIRYKVLYQLRQLFNARDDEFRQPLIWLISDTNNLVEFGQLVMCDSKDRRIERDQVRQQHLLGEAREEILKRVLNSDPLQ